MGRDSIAAAVARLMRAFPDVRFTLDSVPLEGDSARYHWSRGVAAGPVSSHHWCVGCPFQPRFRYFDDLRSSGNWTDLSEETT